MDKADPDKHYIHEAGYFEGLSTVIAELDPQSTYFDWVSANIRHTIQNSPFLRAA
jgi:hypothetical protein